MSEPAIRLAVGAVVGIIVSRYLGPSNLGLLAFCLGLASLVAPIGSLGLAPVLVREFVAPRDRSRTFATGIGSQLVGAAMASLLVFVLVLTLAPTSPPVRLALALALAPLPMLQVSSGVRAYLESTSAVARVVWAGIAATVVAAGTRLFGVMAEQGVVFFAACATFEGLVLTLGLALVLPVAAKRVTRLWTRFDARYAWDLVRQSTPILIGGLAVAAYLRIDVVMLGLLGNTTSVGLYSAATRVSEMLYFVPMAMMSALRPHFSRLHLEGKHERYQSDMVGQLSILVVAGLVAATLVAANAGWLMPVVFGTAFAAAALPLSIHVFSIPFAFLGVASSPYFVDRGLNTVQMFQTGLGAAVNVVLNLVLIPAWGAAGAAVATVVAYAFAGVIANAFWQSTRPLLWMQLRALNPAHAFRSVRSGR
jgi:PST family polysaccharide transporter